MGSCLHTHRKIGHCKQLLHKCASPVFKIGTPSVAFETSTLTAYKMLPQQQTTLRGQQCRAGSRRAGVAPMALFKRGSAAVAEKPSKTTKKTVKEAPKESFISQTINAFDFAEARSKRDRELLYEAKYGERGADGKMTREQYMALRRKIGGTARDYWKDWIEEEQVKNIKTYYKPGEAAAVPFLPFLVGVVVSMLVVTAVVVAKTG